MNTTGITMTISSIERYMSAYSLCMDAIGPEINIGLTIEEVEILRDFDDYSDVAYYLINGDSVVMCDSVNGSVLEGPTPVKEFWESLVKYTRNEIMERDTAPYRAEIDKVYTLLPDDEAFWRNVENIKTWTDDGSITQEQHKYLRKYNRAVYADLPID